MNGDRPVGPWELVEGLRSWAEDTWWVDWVELGGSFGRGGGGVRDEALRRLHVSTR